MDAQGRIVQALADDQARLDQALQQAFASRIAAQQLEVAVAYGRAGEGTALQGDQCAAEAWQRGMCFGIDASPDLGRSRQHLAADASGGLIIGTREPEFAAVAGLALLRALIGGFEHRLEQGRPQAQAAGIGLELFDQLAFAEPVGIQIDAGDARRDLDHLADARRRGRLDLGPALGANRRTQGR
jgi:hypothetical protein